MRGLVVVLSVVVLVLPACAEDGDAAAMGVIDAAYEAFNAGDVETWVDVRDRGSSYGSDDERATGQSFLRAQTESLARANARYDDIVCTNDGFGSWPVADAGEVEGFHVTCDTVLVVEATGVEQAEAFEWVVDDDEVVAVRSDG